MTSEAVRALRCALVAAGFQFLPEITGRKYTAKPYSDWRKRSTPFAPKEVYTNQYGELLNTALILAGAVAFDLDIDQEDDVADAMDIMAEHLGKAVCVRARANSPRRAALYRWEDQSGLYASLKGSDGAIEVFAGPQTKLTAFGWHRDKRSGLETRLTWAAVPGDVQRTDLTLITAVQIDAYLAAVTEVLGDDVQQRRHVPGSAPEQPQARLRGSDLPELYRAASCVPNEGPCDWHTWNRWGMALYAAFGGDDLGLLAFLEWTAKNPSSRHRQCYDRWQALATSPPTAIGIGTVLKAAYANGYQKPVEQAAKDKLAWKKQQNTQRIIANFKPKI